MNIVGFLSYPFGGWIALSIGSIGGFVAALYGVMYYHKYDQKGWQGIIAAVFLYYSLVAFGFVGYLNLGILQCEYQSRLQGYSCSI